MVYLIGAQGFVGSAFSRYFQEAGVDFQPITRQNYAGYISTKCDVLINANGSSKKYLAEQDPKLDFRLNVQSTIDTLIDFDCDLYVLLSSIDVYSDVSDPENNHESIPVSPEKLSNYGFNKYLAELCVKKYSRKWLIVRLGGMVGQGLKKNPVYDLFHGQPLRVHPDSKYQYLNTQDVANLVYRLVSDGHRNEIFNLCGDGVISLKEIQEMLGKPYEDNHLRHEHYEVNIGKVKALYPVPSTASTIRTFLSNYQKDKLAPTG
jgi:nucleoside-diphosphate-sugar epimerase